MKKNKRGRPTVKAALKKKTRSVRVSDMDLKFIKLLGFTAQQIIDDGIESIKKTVREK